MTVDNNQKSVKRIQKEITRLKEEFKKLEIRPCQGDADIRKKDLDLLTLRREIYELEKEANQFAVFISGKGTRA
ncbi:hypothetical protein ACFL0H_04050 [Thermodesulfobacteriota bacterium]